MVSMEQAIFRMPGKRVTTVPVSPAYYYISSVFYPILMFLESKNSVIYLQKK